MEIHEPTMPTESTRTKFAGCLPRDEARCWHDTRKRTMETRNEADRWISFPGGPTERFTGKQERRRGHDQTKRLRYEGPGLPKTTCHVWKT